jgi:hypothetical protein
MLASPTARSTREKLAMSFAALSASAGLGIAHANTKLPQADDPSALVVPAPSRQKHAGIAHFSQLSFTTSLRSQTQENFSLPRPTADQQLTSHQDPIQAPIQSVKAGSFYSEPVRNIFQWFCTTCSVIGGLLLARNIKDGLEVGNRLAYTVWTLNSIVVALAAQSTHTGYGPSQWASVAADVVFTAAAFLWGTKGTWGRRESWSISGVILAASIYTASKVGIFDNFFSAAALNNTSMLCSNLIPWIATIPLIGRHIYGPLQADEAYRVNSLAIRKASPWILFFAYRLTAIPTVAEYTAPVLWSSVFSIALTGTLSFGFCREACRQKRSKNTGK